MVRYLVLVFGMSIVTGCNFTWEPSPGFDEPALDSADMGAMHGGGGSSGAGGAGSPEGRDGMAGPNDLDAGLGGGGGAAHFDMSMEAPDGNVSAPPCHDAGPSPDGAVDGGDDDGGPSCDAGVGCADGGDGACAPVFDGASSPLDAR